MANLTIPTLPINWPLLPLPDENGRITYPTLESSVRDSIKVILTTRPGEQLMRPQFGAGLQNFLNESNTLTTRRRINDAISDSIQQWEPRVILDRLDVMEVPDFPTQVHVDLVYRIRRTGRVQQLGMTLDLGA
ncbi:MAG: baseplate assembly protein [Acidobacteria bacterium]|nr:MAG: baseplate assembly protein [Acidobacteriota bacterium]PYU45703.1 MAG: baseplate assembly protein [Acidobacteriota bacterium]PYU73438.1 MAG: baseplate assembly protein [Acidobacteriota bacterium]